MDINEKFKGRYLKAADLGGRACRYTIASVKEEEVGDEDKVVIRFDKITQGLVLNRTNATVIADAYGADTEGWIGKSILLNPDKTNFNGKRVDCIRVAIPQAKKSPAVQETTEDEDDLNI